MTPDELRDHAAAIMIDHARDVERMSIREHLQEEDVDDPDGAIANAIYDLIAKAAVSVDFPPQGGDES